MFELERLRQSGKVGGRSRRRVDGGGGSDLSSGGSVVSVRSGIHFHWGRNEKLESHRLQLVTG